MSFLNIKFPDDISYKYVGGPEFLTTVTTTKSGKESRIINWQSGRCKYQINLENRGRSQIEVVDSFFRICQGRAYGFRFKDWNDFTSINQPLKQLSSSRSFQTVKEYKQGEFVYVRTITKLVPGTIKIFKNNVLIDSGRYSYDSNTGIVSITDSSLTLDNAVLTYNCEFDVPVRFDSDYLHIVTENTGIQKIVDLNLVEIIF